MELLSNPYGPYVVNSGPESIPEEEITIFVPRYNTPGKHDKTGAFDPESILFRNFYNLTRDPAFYIDNKKERYSKAEEFLSILEERDKTAVLVTFCHGFTKGLGVGLRNLKHGRATQKDKTNYGRFIDLLARHPSPLIILYSCSVCGSEKTDGLDSFAGTVYTDLVNKGCTYSRVVGHCRAGHTTVNPAVRIFDVDNQSNDPLFRTGTKNYRKFRKLLKSDDSFRFQFPFMPIEKIKTKVEES